MSKNRIPLAVKLLFTAFMAALVPVYLYHYGSTNFFYFCDVALILTLIGIWLESPLLLSMPTVGIFLPQMLWVADFLGNCIGHPVTGSTNYMFQAQRAFYLRGLSFFHGWLPFFLLWLVYRVGYDRRAFWSWTVVATTLILISYLFLPPPPAPTDQLNLPVNVNYVYGLSDDQPQEMMDPRLWLALLIVCMPICLSLPVHLALSRWVGPRPTGLDNLKPE
jgi:hypothetical protein